MLTCYCDVSFIEGQYHTMLHILGDDSFKVIFSDFASIDFTLRHLLKLRLTLVIKASDPILIKILENKFVIKYSYVNEPNTLVIPT